MLRMFGFLPPIGCYALAAIALVATYILQLRLVNAGEPADSRIYVVGGILAFLLGFVGFQKYLEQREEAQRPRVSSSDVMQKLVPKETGLKDNDLDAPPELVNGPAADSPLARVRARSAASASGTAQT